MKTEIAVIKRLDLPPLYFQENESDKILFLRMYLFGFPWTWYVCEASIREERLFVFGFVTGDEHEFGYFRLSELLRTSLPLLIDTGFEPVKFSEASEIYGFRMREI